MLQRLILPVMLLVTSAQAIAQKQEFNYNDLLKNKLPANFYNPLPTILRWEGDEQVVLTKRKHPDSAATIYRMNVKNGSMTEIAGASSPVRRTATPAFGKIILSKSNDLYLVENGVEAKRLTNSPAEEEKNPTFSPDSTYVAYTRKNNLFTYNLATNKETQLTTDGTDVILNGYASWVYWEEIFGRATRFRAFWWSPDSKQLAYMRFDESMIPMFPIYVNEGQHGHIEETRYPKAGDKNPEVRVGIVNPAGGATTWADFNEKDDQYFGWPTWNPATNQLWVSWMNRDQNQLKIYEINTANGSKRPVYEEQQKTWITLEDNAGERITFLANNSFILKSDKTGWNHLYLHNNDGSLKNAITEGKFTVLDVKLIDQKNQLVYFTARGLENTARTDLYRVKFNGRDLKRLTFGEFNHSQVEVSPTGKYFITSYSNVTTPRHMALVDNKGKILHQLGSMKGSAMDNYEVAKTELIRIKSADGLYELPAMVTWPLNMDPNKKYPMLISIYGGPDAGRVWDNWTWNGTSQWFAKEGLIQVAFDHRASGHFGKEGVNYMHRNLGYWEMEDYKTMAKWFINNGSADPARIAITGFSYGGYLSAYALTYGADVFTHGMAGGSVTDWSLYDSHYTERFMGTPQNNPEGYKSSSVLNYIDRYKGMLQIVHGTSDDNVHLQNSMQLISALQDKKKHFEFMLYPGGRHGWANMPAKNDHYTNLKNRFIYDHLLRKPIPATVLR
ncbi:S9 family peptidase [Aridibaculum aurantiacum]|uniref:S9 family peptidase n=1 Tax=Aridibaculum aurantiacum TaxID=2810307 RepID=UPI001A95F85E|nr:DPP IV N-terminal domain-containing protein [Aridibaculum aurantiacum]